LGFRGYWPLSKEESFLFRTETAQKKLLMRVDRAPELAMLSRGDLFLKISNFSVKKIQ
jgi:hypothetical protein